MDALYSRNGTPEAWDDMNDVFLDPVAVKQARAEEMSFFKKLGVYRRVPRSRVDELSGKMISVKWLDTNKGDRINPNHRSRLVGREFNVGRDDALYTATPPLEALRLVASHAATHSESGPERVVMVSDVRRAYFCVHIKRDVHIELPKEDKMHGTGMLGKLKLCLYGTRNAAKGWQETVSSHLKSVGFT